MLYSLEPDDAQQVLEDLEALPLHLDRSRVAGIGEMLEALKANDMAKFEDAYRLVISCGPLLNPRERPAKNESPEKISIAENEQLGELKDRLKQFVRDANAAAPVDAEKDE